MRTNVSTTSGGVKNSPALRAGVVGKLLDEIFVGPAQYIGWNAFVRKVVLVKMLDEGMNDFVRDQRLAGTVRRRLVPIHRETHPATRHSH